MTANQEAEWAWLPAPFADAKIETLYKDVPGLQAEFFCVEHHRTISKLIRAPPYRILFQLKDGAKERLYVVATASTEDKARDLFFVLIEHFHVKLHKEVDVETQRSLVESKWPPPVSNRSPTFRSEILDAYAAVYTTSVHCLWPQRARSSPPETLSDINHDVVFLHTLGGHPITSFRGEERWRDRHVCWPREWLPSTVGSVMNTPVDELQLRVLSVAVPYVDNSGALRKRADIAALVLKHLALAKVGWRPCTVVGHGVGGLLLLEMIRLARELPFAYPGFAGQLQCAILVKTPRLACRAGVLDPYATTIADDVRAEYDAPAVEQLVAGMDAAINHFCFVPSDADLTREGVEARAYTFDVPSVQLVANGANDDTALVLSRDLESTECAANREMASLIGRALQMPRFEAPPAAVSPDSAYDKWQNFWVGAIQQAVVLCEDFNQSVLAYNAAHPTEPPREQLEMGKLSFLQDAIRSQWKPLMVLSGGTSAGLFAAGLLAGPAAALLFAAAGTTALIMKYLLDQPDLRRLREKCAPFEVEFHRLDNHAQRRAILECLQSDLARMGVLAETFSHDLRRINMDFAPIKLDFVHGAYELWHSLPQLQLTVDQFAAQSALAVGDVDPLKVAILNHRLSLHGYQPINPNASGNLFEALATFITSPRAQQLRIRLDTTGGGAARANADLWVRRVAELVAKRAGEQRLRSNDGTEEIAPHREFATGAEFDVAIRAARTFTIDREFLFCIAAALNVDLIILSTADADKLTAPRCITIVSSIHEADVATLSAKRDRITLACTLDHRFFVALPVIPSRD